MQNVIKATRLPQVVMTLVAVTIAFTSMQATAKEAHSASGNSIGSVSVSGTFSRAQ